MFFLMPAFLFSQTNNFPDTIFTVNGLAHSCRITDLNLSIVKLNSVTGSKTSIGMAGIKKIYVDTLGIVYTDVSGFNIDMNLIQNLIGMRNNRYGNHIAQNPHPPLSAQKNTWEITLSNGDMISGDILKIMDSDSLIISHLGGLNHLSVDSIVTMRVAGKSNFWKGAGVGFIAGVGAGATIGAALYEKPKKTGWIIYDPGRGLSAAAGGILGGLTGFFIGGVIGNSTSTTDKVYNFSTMNHQHKLSLIHYLLANKKNQ